MEVNNLLEELLNDINQKAHEWPPDKFFEHMNLMVENSRRHIQSQDNAEVRASLLAFYQEIIRYAFACKLESIQAHYPGFVYSAGARC